MAGEDDFARRYAEVLAQHDAAGFLTLIDPEITVLGELTSREVLGNAVFLHPALEAARVCEDKYAFNERMDAHGIRHVPTSLTIPESYPYIRKDRRGSGASGFHVVDTPDDVGESQGDLVFQPFHGGQHHCIDAYFSIHSGTLVDCCAKEVLAKHEGESYLLRSVSRAPFVELVRQVGKALPMRGIVNLDVYDDGSGPTVMEVNCRIGGNYPAAHAFGTNLMSHVVSELLDGAPVEESFSDYVEGAYVSKYIGFSEPYDRH
jgi:predicted ATP-grasp superfamily ATP-dependent carboligase